MAMSNSGIMELVKENNGMITTEMITTKGFSRGSLKYLVDNKMLERTARGVYVMPEIWGDEFVNLQVRLKKGIYSNDTALFLHDLTDRTPNRFVMTFPIAYSLTSVRENKMIVPIRTNETFYNLGISTAQTPAGNIVKVYNVEKTLCDVLRPRNGVDIQLISEAFKRYARSKERNVPLLSEYAKILKVENKVRSYLEVLL